MKGEEITPAVKNEKFARMLCSFFHSRIKIRIQMLLFLLKPRFNSEERMQSRAELLYKFETERRNSIIYGLLPNDPFYIAV